MESQLFGSAILHWSPDTADSLDDHPSKTYGWENRVLKSQINPVGEFGPAVLMFLEQAEQQYDQIKTFLGCNPNMIDNV